MYKRQVDGRGAAALGQHDVHAAHARILSAIVLVHAVARNRYHRRVCQLRFYAEQTYDECIARVIIPKAVKRGKVFGDV